MPAGQLVSQHQFFIVHYLCGVAAKSYVRCQADKHIAGTAVQAGNVTSHALRCHLHRIREALGAYAKASATVCGARPLTMLRAIKKFFLPPVAEKFSWQRDSLNITGMLKKSISSLMFLLIYIYGIAMQTGKSSI